MQLILAHEIKEVPIVSKLTLTLSTLLVGYLNNFKTKILFQNLEIEIEECFDYYALLPIFLINQQEHLNKYLKEINNNQLENKFVNIQLVEVTDTESYFGYIVNLQHNLNDLEMYDCACFLTKSILENTKLHFYSNCVHLDMLYLIFEKYIKYTKKDLGFIENDTEENIIQNKEILNNIEKISQNKELE